MDLPGTFTIMAAVVSFLLAIQWGGVTKPWNDKDVIGTLVGFMALLILFIVIQYVSGDRAVIQGSLLKNRTILVVSIFTFFFAGAFFMLLYYLPIYFQSVDGVSAADSGVRNLPLVLGASIFSIISGGLISYTEHFVPILILGSALTTVSAGLLYTLDVGSTAGQWVGYQLLAGIGIGLALQVPVIAAQSIVAIKDIATVSAMILFFQTIGGAFFVQAGQTAFTNTLIKSISEKAPGIDPTLVIMTGASELSKAFQGKDLAVVIASYMEGLRVTYALAIALAGIGTIVAFFSEWRNLKGKTPVGSAV